MQKPLTKIIVKLMREHADNIESGNCGLSDEEENNLFSIVAYRSLSKEEACSFLNLSRSRFDDLVRLGKIPRGKKLRGRKELVWKEADLYNVINRDL